MNQNEAMNKDFYIRWCKDGKWQSVNIQDLTEKEFRQWIGDFVGLVGVRKDTSL